MTTEVGAHSDTSEGVEIATPPPTESEDKKATLRSRGVRVRGVFCVRAVLGTY